MNGEADLPAGWAWAELGDIAEVRLGKMLDAKQQTGKHRMRYLRNINVQWRRLDTSDLLCMDVKPEEVERYTVQAGDLLVCEGGEPGRCSLVPERAAGLAYQKALHRVRPLGGADARYLAYVLELMAAAGQLERHFTGSTIRHLPREKMLRLSVPVAPAAEQRRIVEALEAHREALDASKAALAALVGRIGSLRLATASRAVTGRLTAAQTGDAASELTAIQASRPARKKAVAGPIVPDGVSLPSGWTWASVAQLAASIDYGTGQKASREKAELSDVPVLRMGNIKDGAILHSGLKYVPASIDDLPRLLLEDGDLLFNRTNSAEHVGKCAVFRAQKTPYTYASYLIRCRFLPGVRPEWVALAINSPLGRAYIRSVVSQQVGQANVNGTKLAAMPVPLPPLATQDAILAVFEKYTAAAKRSVGDLQVLSRKLDALWRSLLEAAFSGDLVDQDPADEPADLLIKRIRETRSPSQPTARRRGSRTVSPVSHAHEESA